MGETSASIVVGASLAEVWDFYFEPVTWAAWVDGFHAVDSSEGYPDEGGTLVWRSIAAGRGEVMETVLEHEPRRLHRVRFSDPESEGEQIARFEIEPAPGDASATRVTLETTYELRSGGLWSGAVDRLFVRSQVRGSLERSLARLRLEVEERTASGSAGNGANA